MLAKSYDIRQTRTYPYKQSYYTNSRGIDGRGADISPSVPSPASSHLQLGLEKESGVHYPHACPDLRSHLWVQGLTDNSK